MSSSCSPPETSVVLYKCEYETPGKVFGDLSESETDWEPSFMSTINFNQLKQHMEKKKVEGSSNQGLQTILKYIQENDTYLNQSDNKKYYRMALKFYARTHSNLVEIYLKPEEYFIKAICSMFPNPLLRLKGKIETGAVHYQTWAPYYISHVIDKSFNLKDLVIAMRDNSKGDHLQLLDSSTPSRILEPLGGVAIKLTFDVIVEWPENYCSPVQLYKGADDATRLIEALYENEASKDFTIIAENGAEVKCHSFILEGQSAPLTAMLSPVSAMKEWQSRRIEMKDMSEAGVNLLLRYFYCLKQSTSELGCDMALELFQAAHKYEITQLEESLHNLLLHNNEGWFAPNNVVELYFYVRHLEAFGNLKEHALRMMIRISPEKLRPCERYQELSSDEKEDLHFKLLDLLVPTVSPSPINVDNVKEDTQSPSETT